MESDVTAHQALAEAERATASLWTVYPSTPWWYCPAGGAWSGALVLALGGLRHPLALLAAVAALYFAAGYRAAALLAFVGATAGLYAYERAYAAAAAAARERLR